MIQDNKAHFNKLNDIGMAGEDIVLQFMEGRGNILLERSEGYFPDWDLKLKNPQGKEITIEVKTDTSKYPNIAIEYKSRGKPSGIYSTKADFYIVYFPEEGALYAAKSADLRLWIAEKNPAIKQNNNNDSNTFIYLIPKSVFTETFQRYAI